MAAKHLTVHESTYVANFPLDKKVSAEKTMQCSPAKRSEDVLHVVRFYVVIFYNKHFYLNISYFLLIDNKTTREPVTKFLAKTTSS